jgi:hypothetical protein
VFLSKETESKNTGEKKKIKKVSNLPQIFTFAKGV